MESTFEGAVTYRQGGQFGVCLRLQRVLLGHDPAGKMDGMNRMRRMKPRYGNMRSRPSC
jgi:hypothetical protein